MTSSGPPASVLTAFGVAGRPVRMDSVAGGHIHRTWRVVTSAGDDVVCQSLNEHVFRDLTSVEENLSRIDRHLAGTGVIATQRRTHDGRVHWGDPSGITWRMSDHVAGSRSARGRLDAASTGNAFGRFLRSLDDLPGGPLRSTIPGFHDLDSRIAAFDAHVRADRLGRLRACRDLVASARRLMSDPSVTADLDAMPWRPVHNDAKVDNLLADDRGRALAVVDLDTVMPGSPLFDLGELLRTGAGDAAEDEPDPGRIEIDDARVSAIVAGFLEGAGPVIDAPTRALAGIAGPRMALENAIRFLGDHLDGDRYFAVHRDGHNLDRGRAQLRVATLLLERRGLIDGVVARQTR